jgi:hypothetical protein
MCFRVSMQRREDGGLDLDLLQFEQPNAISFNYCGSIFPFMQKCLNTYAEYYVGCECESYKGIKRPRPRLNTCCVSVWDVLESTDLLN